jgi:uncharacterized Zn-binding protein involved in type VI secretion
MPEAARGDNTETVNTVHPAVGDLDPDDGIACDAEPTTTSTNACSDKVFVEGVGVVRQDDAVTSHTFPSCGTHAPILVSFSSKVTIQGKGAGRKGDSYECGAIITSGSSKVIIGG